MNFMFLYIISITLSISECQIFNLKVNNMTSNNTSINLTHINFSQNFMGGIVNNSVIYKSVLSNNNLFEMEVVNIPNFTLSNILNIQIIQNQSKGISAIMIYNSSRILISCLSNNSFKLINSANEFQIKKAVVGDNANEYYVYQESCSFIEDQIGGEIQTHIIQIQKYQNSTLVSQTSLTADSCQKYFIDTMVYSKQRLFILFVGEVIVFSTITWQRLFNKVFLFQYDVFTTDMSISQHYLTFSNGPNVYVVSLSDWICECTFISNQIINSVGIIQNYTFYTTLTKIVQFDDNICEIIDQFQLPTDDIQYQIQYSDLTNQFILYRRLTWCFWLWGYWNSYWDCLGKPFLYTFSFDYQYLSNGSSCLPTYGYLAGRCIKNYGRSQPPPLPPSKQTIQTKIVNIEVESKSSTSTLQTIIIPTIILSFSVLASYLAYLLIFHCFEYNEIKRKEKENQKWWETMKEQRDKNHDSFKFNQQLMYIYQFLFLFKEILNVWSSVNWLMSFFGITILSILLLL